MPTPVPQIVSAVRLAAVTGVDMDKEMSLMLTLQTVYGANARVLSTVQSLIADNGFYSQANVCACHEAGIEPLLPAGIMLIALDIAAPLAGSRFADERNSSSEPAANTEEVEVVVAARPLGVGVMIKTQDIRLAKMPAAAVPKGAFTKAEEVLDRPVVSNILLDEPVLDLALVDLADAAGEVANPLLFRGLVEYVLDIMVNNLRCL